MTLQEQSRSAVGTKKNNVENFEGTHMKKRNKKNSFASGKAYHGIGEMVAWDAGDDVKHGGESNGFQLVRRSSNFSETLPSSCPSNLTAKGNGNGTFVTRNKVRETLHLFPVVYRKLVKEQEAKLKNIKRPNLVAATILKSKGKYVNMSKKIIGSVPGVEVGDEFQYRVELNIIGLSSPNSGRYRFCEGR